MSLKQPIYDNKEKQRKLQCNNSQTLFTWLEQTVISFKISSTLKTMTIYTRHFQRKKLEIKKVNQNESLKIFLFTLLFSSPKSDEVKAGLLDFDLQATEIHAKPKASQLISYNGIYSRGNRQFSKAMWTNPIFFVTFFEPNPSKSIETISSQRCIIIISRNLPT